MDDKALAVIEHYGPIHQLKKINEECYELCEAVSDYEYAYNFIHTTHETILKKREHLVEELSDCYALLREVQKFYNIPDEEVGAIMNYKYDRQLGRIEQEKLANLVEM